MDNPYQNITAASNDGFKKIGHNSIDLAFPPSLDSEYEKDQIIEV